MKLSFFIAWRYFFSKKKLGVIHIISLISLIGIAITTAALIIVLSVFNGFTTTGEKILAASNPPLKIESKKGKVFSIDSIPYDKIRNLDKIDVATKVLTENALVSFGDRQSLALIKGIENSYLKINRIDTSIAFGKFELQKNSNNTCITGIGLAYELGIPKNADVMGANIKVMVPKREGKLSLNPEEAFVSELLSFSGSFQMNAEMDGNNCFVPLSFAQEVLNYDKDIVSAIFIRPKNENSIPRLKKEIQSLTGENYTVKDIFEQDPIYHKIIKAERLGVYIILSFIIFIATFNVLGSISLLIMDKKKDILILRSMGSSLLSVRFIYFINGLLLSFFGALIGLVVGMLICFIQQQFGLVKMGSDEFVVESFPVQLRLMDIISVFLLVLSIGAASVSIMVRKIKFDNKIIE